MDLALSVFDPLPVPGERVRLSGNTPRYKVSKVFKEFENPSVEKRRFRQRWDSSPGLSIASLNI